MRPQFLHLPCLLLTLLLASQPLAMGQTTLVLPPPPAASATSTSSATPTAAPTGPWPAGCPLTESQFLALVQLPETQQRQPANQALLRAWLMFQIRSIQETFAGTEVGSLFSLGRPAFFETFLHQLDATPGDTGDVVWCDITGGREGAPTKNIGEPIRFCRSESGINDYARVICREPWHELQHGMLYGKSLTVPVDVGRFHKIGAVEVAQEHAYIERLAEATITWLQKLVLAKKFEDLVREAGAAEAVLRQREGDIGFFLERGIWAKAHSVWKACATEAMAIAPLAPAFRAEYLQHTSVDIPPIEEFIKFYMQGGVKDAASQPIRVPEWVFAFSPPSCPVSFRVASSAVEHLSATWKLKFHLQVMENYARSRNPIQRGTLTVHLENSELGPAWIRVDIASRAVMSIPDHRGEVATEATLFRIPMGQYRPQWQAGSDGPDITFSGFELKKRPPTQFRIRVRFDDERDDPGDPLSFHFDSSEAVYYININGDTPVPPAAPMASEAGGLPSTPTVAATASETPPLPPPPMGRQELVAAVSNLRLEYAAPETWKVTQGKAQYGAIGHSLTGEQTEDIASDWTVGARVSVYLDLNDFSNYPIERVDTKKPPRQSFMRDQGEPCRVGPFEGKRLVLDRRQDEMNRDFRMAFFGHLASDPRVMFAFLGDVTPLNDSRGFDTERNQANRPLADRRREALMQAMIDRLQAHFRSIGGEGPVAIPDPQLIDPNLVASIPAGLDGQPPAPGEVFPFAVTVESRGEPRVVARWYPHPEGFFRFRVPPEWTIEEKATPNHDRLISTDPGLVMMVGRQSDLAVDGTDAYFRSFQDALGKSLVIGGPQTSSIASCPLLRLPGTHPDTGLQYQVLCLALGQRFYTFSIHPQKGVAPEVAYDAALAAISTLEASATIAGALAPSLGGQPDRPTSPASEIPAHDLETPPTTTVAETGATPSTTIGSALPPGIEPLTPDDPAASHSALVASGTTAGTVKKPRQPGKKPGRKPAPAEKKPTWVPPRPPLSKKEQMINHMQEVMEKIRQRRQKP